MKFHRLLAVDVAHARDDRWRLSRWRSASMRPTLKPMAAEAKDDTDSYSVRASCGRLQAQPRFPRADTRVIARFPKPVSTNPNAAR
jgi:hypothetical protein